MNPFRDFALWSGTLAPSQDLEVLFQLTGFGLSFFLLIFALMAICFVTERIIK